MAKNRATIGYKVRYAAKHPARGPGYVRRLWRDQLLRLRSYPCVERRIAEGRLTLRGWYYEVHTGCVREHRADSDAFETL